MTTQKVYASYQEIIDLHTESDRVSILGFHTPSNAQPVRLLQPFWNAYQKVRYLGCSMTMVPAARLPADPSQVSYGAGEPPIDPRDMLNPILFHGCHGNDMGSILNQFYAGENGTGTDVERKFSDSTDLNMVRTTYAGNQAVYESLYYRALTDNTWLKAHPQRGFRKSMRPMVYTLATNTPLNPNSISVRGGFQAKAMNNDGQGPDTGSRTMAGSSAIGSGTTTNTSFQSTLAPGLQTTNVQYDEDTQKYLVLHKNPGTFSGQFFMSPTIRPLGWIDTHQWTSGAGTEDTYNSATALPNNQNLAVGIASNYDANDSRHVYIPKLFMGMCLLPPAYKTEQYFRIVLNHKFAFAKYRGTSMRPTGQLASVGNVVNMYGSPASKGDDHDGDKGVFDD